MSARHACSRSLRTNRGQDADLRSFCLTAPQRNWPLHNAGETFSAPASVLWMHGWLVLTFNTLLSICVAGGSAGVSSRVPHIHRSPSRARASSSGDGRAIESGIIDRSGARVRGAMPDHWELAFSDPGESHYIE